MGGQFSKNSVEVSPIQNDLKYTAELSSYEKACNLDPDLQLFDTFLQARTNHAINTLSAGVQVRAVSFDSLKEVTNSLLEVDQQVAKILFACKEDIWKSRELFELVEEYFDNSSQILDFCTALEQCLRTARDRQLVMHMALQQFEDEDSTDGSKYSKTLEELKAFRAAGDPFTAEFFVIFRSVYRQQGLMLNKLLIRKSKLDKKLKSIKIWRKISYIIFAAAFASLLICSVVVAATAAPPVASALASAASSAVHSVGKWFDSLWKNYEVALERQKGIVISMEDVTNIALQDLVSIWVLVDRLELELESVLYAADIALRGEEAVKVGVEQIKNKLGVFLQSIEDLGQHADKCSQDIKKARTVVLQRIIRSNF